MTLISGKGKGIVLVVIITVLLIGYDECRKKTLNSIDSYGIAKILGKREGKGSKYGVYIYYVDKKKFEGRFDIHYFSKNSFKFYKVKYAEKKPSWSEILLDQPVTDTIEIRKAGFSLPQKKRNQFQE